MKRFGKLFYLNGHKHYYSYEIAKLLGRERKLTYKTIRK